jgi:hypothetical protein
VAAIGVVRMGVSKHGQLYGLPGIDIKIALAAIEAAIGKGDQAGFLHNVLFYTAGEVRFRLRNVGKLRLCYGFLKNTFFNTERYNVSGKNLLRAGKPFVFTV